MKEKHKIILKSKPYIIKTKSFSTIDFVLIFPIKTNKEYLFYLKLIKQLVLTTSYNYKTEEKFTKEYIKLMIVNMSAESRTYNENTFLKFTLTLPNPKALHNYDIESAFKFFIESIYQPNVEKGMFNKKAFQREKEYLKASILEKMKNIYTLSYQKFINIVDDKGILKDNIYNNLNLIKKSNPKELYEIYKELVIDNSPIIFIYGNVDDNISTLVEKYIDIKEEKIIIDKNYYNFLKPFESPKICDETSDYKESILYVAYKIEDMNYYDKKYLNAVKNILGVGVDSLIFKKIRIDKGYAYDVNVWCSQTAGILVVEAYIDNDSKDKVLESIKEAISSLNNESLIKEKITKSIKDMKYHCIREKDSKKIPLTKFITKKIEIGNSIEDVIKDYGNMDIEKLLDFIKRMKLDTVYFFKGEFNEK